MKQLLLYITYEQKHNIHRDDIVMIVNHTQQSRIHAEFRSYNRGLARSATQISEDKENHIYIWNPHEPKHNTGNT